MNIENTLTKYDFIKDEGVLQLNEILKDGTCLKEVHIDIYSENPLYHSSSFMLLLRTSEKNVFILNDNNRIIFKENDKSNNIFLNIMLSKVEECFIKYSYGYSELILNIHNIYYRLTILN